MKLHYCNYPCGVDRQKKKMVLKSSNDISKVTCAKCLSMYRLARKLVGIFEN
jgi:hypothetical protein